MVILTSSADTVQHSNFVSSSETEIQVSSAETEMEVSSEETEMHVSSADTEVKVSLQWRYRGTELCRNTVSSIQRQKFKFLALQRQKYGSTKQRQKNRLALLIPQCCEACIAETGIKNHQCRDRKTALIK